MWFADIYCDFSWVSERQGILGTPRFHLHGGKSSSLGISFTIHFFGDDHNVGHIRVVLHTENQQIAETCVDRNIQPWVNAIECAVLMETKRPFQVARLPGSQLVAVALGQGDENSPAAVIEFNAVEPNVLSYQRLAYGLAAWTGDSLPHLFYFRRFIDSSLPVDVRWLNGYRLLEWHFVGKKAGLGKSAEWQSFVERFRNLLEPALRKGQTCFGLLEEARALAAHAGMDDRSDAERARDPRNVMVETFCALEAMVISVINDLPSRRGNPVTFVSHSHAHED